MINRLLFWLTLILVCIVCKPLNAQIISIETASNLNILAGTTFTAGGLEMNPSHDFILNASINLNTMSVNSAAFPYIPAVYQFSQTTNPFSGALKINYLDSGLVGLGFTESTLKILYYDGLWAIDNSSINVSSAKTTLSGSLSEINLNEVLLGICLTSSSTITMKLSNQTTLAKLLSPTLHIWSIFSGDDSSDFSFSLYGNPQQLLFNSVVDNASPQDANLDNVYLINVTNGCETQNLAITISPFCGRWSDIVTP